MIREDVVFDFANALREIDRVETRFDSAFGEPIPVRLDTDAAIRDARQDLSRFETDPIDVPLDLDTDEVRADVNQLEGDINFDEPIRDARFETERFRTEMQEAEDAASQLDAKTEQLDDNLDRAADEARRLDDNLDRTGVRGTRSMDSLGGSIGRITAGVAAGVVAVRGLGEAFRFIGRSFGAASDAEEAINKVNVVFGDLNDEVLEFTANAPETFGLATREANEMVATFGNLFVSLGLAQDEAADMSTEIVQLGADLASFNNLEVDEALVKLRAGLVGEFESLRTLGVALNAAQVEAKAFELGLVDAAGEVTEAGKVQARYQLILENTATAQGDFARTSDGIANSQRTVNSQFEDFRQELGEALIPVLGTFLDLAPEMLEDIDNLIPAIANLATQLSNAGESEGFETILQGLADIPRGFGAVTDVAVGAGNFITAPFQGLIDLARTGDITAPFDQVVEGYEGIGRAGDNVEIRVIEQDVIDGLRRGVDETDAFTQALLRLDDGSTLTLDSLERFQTLTGVTTAESIPVLEFLIDNQDAFDLSADTIALLTERLDDFRNQQRSSAIEAAENRDRAAFAAAAAAETARQEATALEELQAAADDAGLPLLDFVDANEDVVTSILGSATPFQEWQANMEIAKLRAEELFNVLQEEGSQTATFPIFEQLPETLGAVNEEINEQTGELEETIDSSAEAILERIQEQNEATAEFEANLVRLASEGFGALAQRLREEGPGAAAAAADFLENLDVAAEAEEELTGTGQNAASSVTGALAEDLEGFDFSSPAGIMVLNLAQDLENPALLNALREVGAEYFDQVVAGMTGQGPLPALPPPPIPTGHPTDPVPRQENVGHPGGSVTNIVLDNFRSTDLTGAAQRAAATANAVSAQVN